MQTLVNDLMNTMLLMQAATPAAVTPWWGMQQGTLIGAFGGAGVGVLGATLGPAMGIMLPRGKGKGIILPALLVIGVLGVVALITGLVALISGQPYHVWYPLTLIGLIASAVMLPLYFVARARYRAAERNRMEAQDLLR